MSIIEAQLVGAVERYDQARKDLEAAVLLSLLETLAIQGVKPRVLYASFPDQRVYIEPESPEWLELARKAVGRVAGVLDDIAFKGAVSLQEDPE